MLDIVTAAFKKYAKSSRECLRPDPKKIRSAVGQRLKNWAYTISKNDLKTDISVAASEDLMGKWYYNLYYSYTNNPKNDAFLMLIIII